MTADGRAVPKTDADRAQALKSMIAYTGRYRVENGQVITKVEAAWNEGWVGGEQVRNIRFEGEQALHREPADAASEYQRQDGAGHCGVGA